MLTPREKEIVRRFAENGLKLLLENSANVRELLTLGRAEGLAEIDFELMKPTSTSFVTRDYRHVETDIVLVAPLRHPGKKRAQPGVFIYVLIEHQSEPDELMPLRALDYVVQIYKSQLRDWLQQQGSPRKVRLLPVLAVVFYTGTRTWESVGPFSGLVELSAVFGQRIPALEPLFINVGALDPARVEAEGGFFGQVLRLVVRRRVRLRDFRGLLHEVVQRLEGMPEGERMRWRELLSYLHALVYHERQPPERPGLNALIETSALTEAHRREIATMRKTIADELKEEGGIETARRILLLQLRERFGEVPAETRALIETTSDMERLEDWARQLLNARTLKEVGIHTAP
jgi:hypothetical protein